MLTISIGGHNPNEPRMTNREIIETGFERSSLPEIHSMAEHTDAVHLFDRIKYVSELISRSVIDDQNLAVVILEQ
jgi:3-deoxy-D-manno-octulosonic-acid transferase